MVRTPHFPSAGRKSSTGPAAPVVATATSSAPRRNLSNRLASSLILGLPQVLNSNRRRTYNSRTVRKIACTCAQPGGGCRRGSKAWVPVREASRIPSQHLAGSFRSLPDHYRPERKRDTRGAGYNEASFTLRNLMKRTRVLIVFALAAVSIAQTRREAERPLRQPVRGVHGAVAAGSEYATEAGMRTYYKGGNAVDVGVATMFSGSVSEL